MVLVNIDIFADNLLQFVSDELGIWPVNQHLTDLLAALLSCVSHALAALINRCQQGVIKVLASDQVSEAALRNFIVEFPFLRLKLVVLPV